MGKRRKQPLDNLQGKGIYRNLKEETLNGAVAERSLWTCRTTLSNER